jgi:hypothetical protein
MTTQYTLPQTAYLQPQPQPSSEDYVLNTQINQQDPNTITAGMSPNLLDSLYPNAENMNLDPTSYASAGQARTYTRQVGDNELASSNLDRILAHDSPLRRRALQEGIDYAASRGLVNSSIAGGNAFGSLIDRATPLATFDASAYQTGARDNQTAQNQVGLFNAGQRTQTSLANAGADNQFRNLLAQGQIGSMADVRQALFGIENREDQQAYGTSEREGSQGFQTGERLGSQGWQTGEREGSQDFQMLFQQSNQDFEESMRALDRDLTREGYDAQTRQSILQALTQARSNQAQIESNAALAIYQNPNLDAGQQNRAFSDFRTSVSNDIFNSIVADFPDMPDLFPGMFGGGG